MQIMWISFLCLCIKLGKILFLPSRTEYLEKKKPELFIIGDSELNLNLRMSRRKNILNDFLLTAVVSVLAGLPSC